LALCSERQFNLKRGELLAAEKRFWILKFFATTPQRTVMPFKLKFSEGHSIRTRSPRQTCDPLPPLLDGPWLRLQGDGVLSSDKDHGAEMPS
jgi:hypothetical protein